MVSLAGILGNNSTGYRHKLTKVNRAIKNTSGRLLDAVFSNRKHYLVKMENNAFLEVIWGTPAYERLEKCFDHLARGVFYHHFETRFKGRLKVLMGYLDNTDRNSVAFTKFIKHRASIDLKGVERSGRNASVFYYQFTKPDQFGFFALKLCFYEGVDVFVSFIPDGVEVPFNLPMKLIEGGIKTVITLDGTSYEFN